MLDNFLKIISQVKGTLFTCTYVLSIGVLRCFARIDEASIVLDLYQSMHRSRNFRQGGGGGSRSICPKKSLTLFFFLVLFSSPPLI